MTKNIFFFCASETRIKKNLGVEIAVSLIKNVILQ